MTSDSSSTVRPEAPRGFSQFSRWPGLIPRVDQDPRILAYVQYLPGRISLFAGFAILVALLGGNVLLAPIAAASAYSGRYRWHAILFGTFLMLFQSNFRVDFGTVMLVADQEGIAEQINQPLLFAGTLAFVFLSLALLLRCWHRIAAVAIFRRSTLWLVAGFLALVLVAQSPMAAGLARVLIWSFLVTLLPYLWFLAYALADSSAHGPLSLVPQLGVFQSFWGASLTPFGKGVSYLRRFEAKTSQELAVTQLKGLKLAAWALLLAVCLNGFTGIVHEYLAVPAFEETFLQYVAGTAYPRYSCLESLLAYFFEDLLHISVQGGLIVSCARMAGFRLLRNTYRPLGATTLAEFWNRYYFYYKELLVDHFFYPAFLRYFRSHRKLRMFCATFAAACVGNLLFHFIRDIRFVAQLGLWKAVVGDASHAFYTLLLATGVSFSQLRIGIEKAPKAPLHGRLLSTAGVVLFFCLLHVFDAPLDRTHQVGQRGEFLLYILGFDV